MEENKHLAGRRIFAPEWKCQIVKQAINSDSSVSVVAREHDLNTNQVFRWIREFKLGNARWVRLVKDELPCVQSHEPTRFLPVTLSEPLPKLPEPTSSCIVVELAGGHRMTVDTSDPDMLKALLSALA